MLDEVSLELREGYKETTGVDPERQLQEFDLNDKKLTLISKVIFASLIYVAIVAIIVMSFKLSNDSFMEFVYASIPAILALGWSILSTVTAQTKRDLATHYLDQFGKAVKSVSLIKFNDKEEWPSVLTHTRIRQNMVGMAKDVLEADKLMTWWKKRENKENTSSLKNSVTRYEQTRDTFEAAEEGLKLFGLKDDPNYANASVFAEAGKDDTPEAVAARKKRGEEKFDVPLQVIRP